MHSRYFIPLSICKRWMNACNRKVLVDFLPHLTPSPFRRRQADHALEGAREGGFGVVTHIQGNRRDVAIGLAQQARAQLHAPVGQVLHGRHSQKFHEAFVQGGAGQADCTGQFIDLPDLRRPFHVWPKKDIQVNL